MRRFFIPILLLLVVSACKYRFPVTTEHTIAIDKSLLGLWEFVDKEKTHHSNPDRLLVLPYSDTEYLIHYPVNKDDLYFRAYTIKFNGEHVIQTQLIGEHDGNSYTKDDQVYDVVSYRFKDNLLEVKTLNHKLVGESMSSQQALLKRLAELKGHSKLFNNPGYFKKIEK